MVGRDLFLFSDFLVLFLLLDSKGYRDSHHNRGSSYVHTVGVQKRDVLRTKDESQWWPSSYRSRLVRTGNRRSGI
jgi:hypothetical protein